MSHVNSLNRRSGDHIPLSVDIAADSAGVGAEVSARADKNRRLDACSIVIICMCVLGVALLVLCGSEAVVTDKVNPAILKSALRTAESTSEGASGTFSSLLSKKMSALSDMGLPQMQGIRPWMGAESTASEDTAAQQATGKSKSADTADPDLADIGAVFQQRQDFTVDETGVPEYVVPSQTRPPGDSDRFTVRVTVSDAHPNVLRHWVDHLRSYRAQPSALASARRAPIKSDPTRRRLLQATKLKAAAVTAAATAEDTEADGETQTLKKGKKRGKKRRRRRRRRSRGRNRKRTASRKTRRTSSSAASAELESEEAEQVERDVEEAEEDGEEEGEDAGMEEADPELADVAVIVDSAPVKSGKGPSPPKGAAGTKDDVAQLQDMLNNIGSNAAQAPSVQSPKTDKAAASSVTLPELTERVVEKTARSPARPVAAAAETQAAKTSTTAAVPAARPPQQIPPQQRPPQQQPAEQIPNEQQRQPQLQQQPGSSSQYLPATVVRFDAHPGLALADMTVPESLDLNNWDAVVRLVEGSSQSRSVSHSSFVALAALCGVIDRVVWVRPRRSLQMIDFEARHWRLGPYGFAETSLTIGLKRDTDTHDLRVVVNDPAALFAGSGQTAAVADMVASSRKSLHVVVVTAELFETARGRTLLGTSPTDQARARSFEEMELEPERKRFWRMVMRGAHGPRPSGVILDVDLDFFGCVDPIRDVIENLGIERGDVEFIESFFSEVDVSSCLMTRGAAAALELQEQHDGLRKEDQADSSRSLSEGLMLKMAEDIQRAKHKVEQGIDSIAKGKWSLSNFLEFMGDDRHMFCGVNDGWRASFAKTNSTSLFERLHDMTVSWRRDPRKLNALKHLGWRAADLPQFQLSATMVDARVDMMLKLLRIPQPPPPLLTLSRSAASSPYRLSDFTVRSGYSQGQNRQALEEKLLNAIRKQFKVRVEYDPDCDPVPVGASL